MICGFQVAGFPGWDWVHDKLVIALPGTGDAVASNFEW